MKNITSIKFINSSIISQRISDFYIKAKQFNYSNSYGWDEILKDIKLAYQDKHLTPTNKTTDKWLETGCNVARNKRGWAFTYIIKGDTIYIYDAENCKNLTLDYQNTEPFVMSNIYNPQQRQNFPMGYKISACRLNDGYIYLYKNGRQVPDYRFNEILKIFRKHKNGEIYAVGLYGGKKFKITLDGIASALFETKIQKLISESTKKHINLLIESYTKRRLGKYNVVKGDERPNSVDGLEKYGHNLYDYLMYDSSDETYCVFRIGKKSKRFICCKLEYEKDSKIWLGFTPIKHYNVPLIIKQDLKNQFRNRA